MKNLVIHPEGNYPSNYYATLAQLWPFTVSTGQTMLFKKSDVFVKQFFLNQEQFFKLSF
jgi:hypothetical protein